jgi:hypothetical protein
MAFSIGAFFGSVTTAHHCAIAPSIYSPISVQPITKDGITATLSGVVNTYYSGTASVSAGAISISVSAPRAGGGPAIAEGDLLMVIQMQGADINTNNDNTYGDGQGNGHSGDTTDYTDQKVNAASRLCVCRSMRVRR